MGFDELSAMPTMHRFLPRLPLILAASLGCLATAVVSQNAFPACVTIIDPRFADDDTRLITVIPDVAEGADFLKWKRRKAA